MSTLKPFSGELDAPASTATSAGLQSFKGTLDGEKTKRSLWSAINDTVIEGANAAAGTASAVGNFISPGNTASKWIDKNIIEAGEANQTDVVKAEKARYSQEMDAAQGVGDEAGATLGYIGRNPLLAAAQAAGSFAGPGLAVKGAGLAAGAAGFGAKGATRAGLAAGAGLGAAGAGGDAAGTAYDLSREGGATDEQAVAAARGASVLPAAIGAAGGLVGAERLVAGAKGFGGGLVSRALKTGAVEGAQEALEEGVTQYEGQRAAVPFNPDLDPMKGVAGAATMGAVLGGATGAGASVLTQQNRPVRKPSEELGLNPDNGPMSKLAAAAVDSKPLQLAHNPDPMVSFPDGSVGTQSQLDAYLGGLPEGERAAARAKLMGLGPQAADSHLPPEGWQGQYQDQPVRQQDPVDDPLGDVQNAVRQATEYTDAAQVEATRSELEDAWLALNVGDEPVQQASMLPTDSGQADITPEVDARVRAGRVASGVRNAFDGGAPNTLRVIQHVNQGLRTIGEQPLTSPEIARIRRLADARTAFEGLNQPANLPADRVPAAPAVDANADNSSMEALIPERGQPQPTPDPSHTETGLPHGSTAPIDYESQAAAPSAPQDQTATPAVSDQPGGLDVTQASETQQGTALPQTQAAASIEGETQTAQSTAAPDVSAQFSRGAAPDQTQSDAFKAWYGEWQNAGHVQEQLESYGARARTPQDGGNSSVHGLQRSSGMDQDAPGADPVRGITFTGASGPKGADGAPVRFYHGTKDDIAAFDLSHPGRKDLGWLGNGVYLTSNEVDAEGYSRAKSGAHAPNVMPLYANVRNPYEASQADKQRLKHASQAAIQAFTQEVKAKGHDGVVLRDAGGDIELVVFDPAQVKSATGNNGGFDGSNPDIRYSLTAKAASNPTAIKLRRAMVQRTIDGLSKGWSKRPSITVVDSMEDPRVPEAVRKEDAAQRSQGATGEPEGFWYQGQVYLVASALPTSADATRVLYHEVLGHHGLRGHFGAELDKVLDQVTKLRRKDVAAKASEYGLDMGNPDHVAYAAEEVLAELAQTRPDLGFVQRAIAAIRNFLRSHVPGFKALELTDADIVQGYLLPARGWVERSGLLDAQEEAASSMEPAAQAFSRAPSVESAAFKRWYGDWQNATQGVPNNDSINLDTRGERALNTVQREGSVGAYPDGATRVGDFTFPGASGPVGRDGAPARLFHGTRDDITAFDRGAASRKDNGWLGAGFYFTSEPFIADLYSGAKQGAVGRNTMPVYVAVRNPYVASHAEKAEMKHWTRERLEQHTQALIEQGYDGVVLEGDDGVIELVAFEPTQVKSAIGNNGNYDPANPDIRYSRSQPADAIRSSMGSLTADQERKASWAAPSASQWDDLTYKLQDKHIDTKRVLESIRATGKAIGDDLDVYLQEELYHGRAAKRTEDFVAQELEPLVRYMSGAGLKMPELEEFLHARHAKEANAVIAQRNPDLPDGGSGMTNAEADAVMAAYSPTKRSLLGKAAEKVDAIIAQTRQTFVEYGLESQDTVDAWSQAFAHYVPLMREQEGDGMAGLGTGQGFSVKGKEVKGRTGSTKKVVDILANIAMQRERAIVRGEKNRVAAALVGLAKANPSGFWKVDVVPTRQVLGKDGMVKTEHDPLYKQRENVLVAKIPEVDAKTGKVVVKEHAVLFDENDARALRMAQALKNLDAAQLEGMLGATAKVTRYLAAINTQYNPIFGVTNLARDLQGAAINLQSTELAGRHGEVLAQSLPALRGIYSEMRAQRKGETTGTPWSQLWEEFQGVGGQTGYRDQFRTSADRGEAIEKALDPGSWADSGLGKLFTANGALKVPMEFARKKAQWLFQWLEDYNTAMENGVRLATYKAGLDAGLSKERAASIAKNLTTNFNRKGQVAQQVGALYAFFNASMQGTARIGQALFTMEPGKPKTMRLSPLGKKVVFGGVTLGVMQALLLAAAGFDEGEPQEFVRERNLIIPVGGKKYIAIPMPLGLHVLPNLGRIPAEFAMGGFQNPSATAIKVMSLFADAFNPMGSAGLSMQTLVPTVLDPLAALAENKDFSGRSIAKESFNQATPGHALGRDSASALATWVAQAINFLSGGTQYVRGEFSPTPDQIEYLVGQATGGVGRELLKLQSTAKGLMDGDEVQPHKVPLLGRFYGDSDTPSAKQATFYGHMDSVRRHAEQVKGLRLDGNASEALAYAASHPEARLAFAARKASQDVQKMRELRRDLELQGASKEAIRDMDQRMVRRMELFNELVGRTVGAS